MTSNKRAWRINTMVVTALVASILTVSKGVGAQSQCAINRPRNCGNTNELVLSAGFGEAVKDFFSGYQGNYVRKHGSAATQTLDVLGGPPSMRKDVGKLSIFTACMPHNCTQKGIVFVGHSGRIIAIGILHSTCMIDQNSACFSQYLLTLFFKTGDVPNQIFNEALTWAGKEVEAGNVSGVSFHNKFIGMDKVVLPR